MFLPPTQQVELCSLAAWSDHEARSDLAAGFIRDEDDYTSTFAGSLRRNINAHSRTGLRVVSYMVEPSIERRTGCDAVIIIDNGTHSKVTLFEAKLPHLKQPGRPWDYEQTATGLSHFSDQLSRQKQLPSEFAVFEMFYCDHPFAQQPIYMDDRLSSCLWRDAAVAFDASRGSAPHPWTSSDLQSLLGANKGTIIDMLQDVCNCQVGTPLRRMDSKVLVGEFRLEGHIIEISARSQG